MRRTASRGIWPLLVTLVLSLAAWSAGAAPEPARGASGRAGYTVCPPFFLRDERGQAIDPVHGRNAKAPYSPKRTCGACHDYDKITDGYHFQQGRGEKPTPEMAKRYRWVSSPGNYGGTWCSPAPLYRALAPKKNTNPRMIDMTSFDFVTATCGNCHPGGGPLEYDRDGKRYDERMRDPRSGMKAGAPNGLDGDYFKARWSETGVIEADCLLCHLPEYDYKGRNKQLEQLNFRWAATAGSQFAAVKGAVKEGTPVTVTYDPKAFDEEGKVSPHIVAEPRTETCLNCHAKPQWKKRGASFHARTDVHLRAGLECVDCHSAGSRAADPRVRGKELHQLGKGDDPSGHVRDDLDNTVRQCADCHATGYLGAPVAQHRGLPPLHLKQIACQTCHIPQRYVKSAHVQVSDVFNPGPKITPPAKHIWTFYDAGLNYWNHYGELNMLTNADQPTDPYRPVLARYKGVIYPVNRVHSAWPGLLEDGKEGLNQPSMKDVFSMWKEHNGNPSRYPALSQIRDDSGDGMPEVNRPEEIDALIASVTARLQDTKFDLAGKKVVWVNNDRAYTSGTQWTALPKHEFEASPYASVYKYSHDVSPARTALGVNGCTDCHHRDAAFFFAPTVRTPFGPDGKPVTDPQHVLLQTGAALSALGGLREGGLKPFFYVLSLAMLCFVAGTAGRGWAPGKPSTARGIGWAVAAGTALLTALVLLRSDLIGSVLPSRAALDANHLLVAAAVFLAGLAVLLRESGKGQGTDAGTGAGSRGIRLLLTAGLGLCAVCGLLMLLAPAAASGGIRASYTGFDLGMTVVAAALLAVLARNLSRS